MKNSRGKGSIPSHRTPLGSLRAASPIWTRHVGWLFTALADTAETNPYVFKLNLLSGLLLRCEIGQVPWPSVTLEWGPARAVIL
jgi:hypothetical protein